mmetsp:Transcript_38895/g.62093  ORF Transcript_38895/g.62093 Transcript_38895/m.62093 type:complete len:241 (-) Transcript_38895:17-739(-)
MLDGHVHGIPSHHIFSRGNLMKHTANLATIRNTFSLRGQSFTKIIIIQLICLDSIQSLQIHSNRFILDTIFVNAIKPNASIVSHSQQRMISNSRNQKRHFQIHILLQYILAPFLDILIKNRFMLRTYSQFVPPINSFAKRFHIIWMFLIQKLFKILHPSRHIHRQLIFAVHGSLFSRPILRKMSDSAFRINEIKSHGMQQFLRRKPRFAIWNPFVIHTINSDHGRSFVIHFGVIVNDIIL